MTDETNNPSSISDDAFPARHQQHERPHRNSVFIIRQVLNVVFMLLAVIGAVMYLGLLGDGNMEQMGIIVIIIAVCCKMAECMLRFLK